MTITPEQRDERYEAAEPAIKQLYSSSESGEIISKIFAKHLLPEGSYKTYAITIGNVILGFYPVDSLPRLLVEDVNISVDRAKKITDDLTEFLSPLNKTENTSAQLPNTDDDLTDQDELPSDIASKTTKAHPELQALKTMEQDAERAHGYDAYRVINPRGAGTPDEAIIQSTSQEDMLAPRKKLTDTPTYNEPS